MRRGAALMLQGNRYFAWQYTFFDEKGEPDQAYRPCLYPAQFTRYESDVFEGIKTAGFYAIRPDNLTRWGAIDFDAHGTAAGDTWYDEAQRAYDLLAPKSAEAWLLESSPGRFHLVLFFAQLAAARDVRTVLCEHAPAGVEVFPKQDMLKVKGSLLRFPGKHQLRGTWARFVARHGRIAEPEKGIPAAEPKGGKWEEPSPQGRLRSLYARATREIIITGPGQRFRAMQKVAGRLKGRANKDEALGVYTTWHKRNEANIRTSLEESRKEFLACFDAYDPCKVELPDYPLSDAVQAKIAALPKMPDVRAEHLRETARLLLCAKRFADSKGLPEFFLANRVIAERLSCSINTASRVRSACVELGVVQVIKHGHTGWATEYRLGKEWEPICQKQNGSHSLKGENIKMVHTSSKVLGGTR
jgi:hypothetical protein